MRAIRAAAAGLVLTGALAAPLLIATTAEAAGPPKPEIAALSGTVQKPPPLDRGPAALSNAGGCQFVWNPVTGEFQIVCGVEF